MPINTFPNYGGAVASTRGGGLAPLSAANIPAGYVTPSFSSSAYGSRPAPTKLPASIYDEAAAANPALFALDQKSTGVINSQMSGTLSPEEIRALQDNAAAFGVSNGVAGSGLQINGGLRTLGIEVGKRQQQGLGNYQNALKSLASLQLDPSLVSGLNTYNNQLAAAPDPAAAAAQEEALYQSHYGQSRAAQAEDAARAEALYQTHYAQNKRDSATQTSPGSGGVSYGGSSSMFKPTGKAPVMNPQPDGSMAVQGGWNDRGLHPGQSQDAQGHISGTIDPAWKSAQQAAGSWGDNQGYVYIGDPAGEPAYNTRGVYMGANPNGPNPAGGTGYDSFFPSAPITDTYNENYDAMLDPNSPDYQPGGAT